MAIRLKRGMGDDVPETIAPVDSGMSFTPVLIAVGVAALLVALLYTPSTRPSGGPASSVFPKEERPTVRKRRRLAAA